MLTIADRFSASRVFFFSSLVAATANLTLVWLAKDIFWLMTLRFVTGFFLAGIYPVGMKIAAEHFPQKLGNALGFLVGSLVFGTAFPHILRSQLQALHWQNVLLFTSALALIGGLLILFFVPHSVLKTKSLFNLIQYLVCSNHLISGQQRSDILGICGSCIRSGHLFLLFFPPTIISIIQLSTFPPGHLLLLQQVVGGAYLEELFQKKPGAKSGFLFFTCAGICCLFSPVIFNFSQGIFLLVLFIWGLTVVSDSPQFSTMVAQSAQVENKGTALTIVTSIGFAITILSIHILKAVADSWKQNSLILFAIGPLLGLIALKKYLSH